MKLRTLIFSAALFAGLFSLSQVANAAKAYYVIANRTVYARSEPGSYAMGRLYPTQRMDVQHTDPRGWVYGYAYGHINRCVWAQDIQNGEANFSRSGTVVSDKCRSTDKYLHLSEFTTGEIWGDGDGEIHFLARATHMWDNWVWGGRWGNHSYRGVARAGSRWKIRYTTNDGGGVMARPCPDVGACYEDWMFIQRSSIDTIHCGYLIKGEYLGARNTINSCDGRFSLTMQGDGNLVLYQSQVAIWSTGTSGTKAQYATMQEDGNFVVYAPFAYPVWNSGTWGAAGSWLSVQNDGNVVVYAPNGAWLWQSNTCCR